MANRLTHKQERFAHLVAEGNTQSDAYRLAYNAENMTDKSVWELASALANDTKVSSRIDELRERNAKRNEVTVEKITGMLNRAYIKADQKDMPSAAVNAAMGIAKLHGLIVEKKADVTASRDTADIDARIRALLAEFGASTTAEPSGGAEDSGKPDEAVPPVSRKGTAEKGTVH